MTEDNIVRAENNDEIVKNAPKTRLVRKKGKVADDKRRTESKPTAGGQLNVVSATNADEVLNVGTEADPNYKVPVNENGEVIEPDPDNISGREEVIVTTESDRISNLDKTLEGKDREFVDLMRKKGKSQEMINQKIKSSARNTAAGNQLLTRYKAEDTLQNPEGKTLAQLVSAYSLLFTDKHIPARTINDMLHADPDLRYSTFSSRYSSL